MRYRGNLSGNYNPLTGSYDPPATPIQRFQYYWEGADALGRISLAGLAVVAGWLIYALASS